MKAQHLTGGVEFRQLAMIIAATKEDKKKFANKFTM